MSPGAVSVEKRANGGRTIVGYAAVFYDGTPATEYALFEDLHERIMPGAFDRVISDRHNVAALFNHDANVILGRTKAGTMRLSVDSKGLRYEIDAPETEQARAVITAIDRQDVAGSSFKFRVLKQMFVSGGDFDIREIHDLTMDNRDCGPVVHPAYEAATVSMRSLTNAGDCVRSEYEAWKSERSDPRDATVRVRARMVELGLD
jgi:hypothetical protein